jgi:hypothetical protein
MLKHVKKIHMICYLIYYYAIELNLLCKKEHCGKFKALKLNRKAVGCVYLILLQSNFYYDTHLGDDEKPCNVSAGVSSFGSHVKSGVR